jgi:hypothetical protein
MNSCSSRPGWELFTNIARRRTGIPVGAQQLLRQVPRQIFPRPDRFVRRAAANGREHSDSGPWLPLRVGHTYRARVVTSSDGFTNVPPGMMLMSLGSNLVTKLPKLTNGTPVTITVATRPDLIGVQTGLGTGPMLVHEGKIFEVTARMSEQVHPRSALGWNDKYLYLAVADGRQPGFSVGVRLSQMAEFMAEIGCTEVINMDGGPSTRLMLNGAVINHPTDAARTSRNTRSAGEREIANGIVILRKPAVEEDVDQ